MTVTAISMVRDEADIVEATVLRMARQVDRVIIADNGSTDGTRKILEHIAGDWDTDVTVIDDPEVGYYQSFKMSALAHRALDEGAEWVVPFDADEVWLTYDGARIADTLRALPAEVLVCEAALFDHVATGVDPARGNPVRRIGWRRAEQAPLRKVAVRAIPGVTIHQGNHGADFRDVPHPPTVTNALQVRHFPYRSPEQMIRKARNGAQAYAATTLPESVGGHWRSYGRILHEQGEDALADVFRRYFWRATPDQPYRVDSERQPPLVYDPVP
jgi:glycosyltransferase involved in cell wall biosynthesis